MEPGEFKVKVCREERYKFRISFHSDKEGDIFMDEPEPLGKGEYPNAGKLLAAAVGNCMCASLVYCMERSRGEVPNICAEVFTTLSRNERGRLRITHIAVKMFPEVENDAKFQRCREVFEDFCIVTQSVRQGIDVDVEVFPTRSKDPSV
ncbi:OsmC family protein [Methanomassiliicoccus luminyensis]|uniref:OsmC family protein n=1 Tax=Methanomassiliicoccus luminyensis TaxID=1080712 RepID=UPI00037926E8|nr:OsmC family protein [Methanomassiliicoccus luminyensis]